MLRVQRFSVYSVRTDNLGLGWDWEAGAQLLFDWLTVGNFAAKHAVTLQVSACTNS